MPSTSKESASTLLHSADADRKRQATLRKLMAEDDDDEEVNSMGGFYGSGRR
jgi:hypothetical protein